MSKITLFFIGLLVFQNIQAIEIEARLALVIGNSEYKGDAFLANPVNDAQDLAEVLSDLQFQVSHRQNLTRAAMNSAIEEFGKNLKATKGMGIFYYAGHGMQVGGENYLIPIGGARALFKAGYDLDNNTIKASNILKTLEAADNAVNIIILDACRDNPFQKRGISRRPTSPGLQLMNAPGGSLIAYSADQGEVAFEGKNKRNSPYAASLIQQIKDNPNSSLLQLFTKVRADVFQKTGEFQAPGFYSKLNQDYCLMGACSKAEIGVDLGELIQQVAHLWQPILVMVIAIGVLWLGWRMNLVGAVVTWGRYQAAPTVFDIGAKTWRPIVVAAFVMSVAWFGWQQSWLSSVATWSKYLSELVITEQSFRDSLQIGGYGPEMVVIPAGRFQMGAIQSSDYSEEKPVHWVDIDYEFAMGKYEVTFAEYDKFAEATDREKPNDGGWGRENRPVIYVSWNDAVAYTEWLSEQTGKEYRLPSEAEWEYAARAGTETKYWWGNTASHEYANYGEDECCGGLAKGKDRWEYTSPVGSFSANQFGLYDTVGNVWEWVADGWHKNYTNAPNDGRTWTVDADDSSRVLRGGSWNYFPSYVRAAYRYWYDRLNRNIVVGFRVAARAF